MATPVHGALSSFIAKTVEFNKKVETLIAKGNPDAIAWAKKVGLKHLHATGYGCHEGCLNGITYRPDPDARSWRPVLPGTTGRPQAIHEEEEE